MIADKSIESVVQEVNKGNLTIALDRVVVHPKNGNAVPLEVPCEVKQDHSGLHFILRTTPLAKIPEAIVSLLGETSSSSTSVTPKVFFDVEATTQKGLTVRLGGVVPLTSNHPRR